MTEVAVEFVDVDALLRQILIPALALAEDSVQEQRPADYLNRLTFVHAYRWGGAAIHPRFLDEATVDVHVYAATKTAALATAVGARSALYLAWERQNIYPAGSVASFAEQAAPTELRTKDQPGQVTVVQATYRLGVSAPITI